MPMNAWISVAVTLGCLVTLATTQIGTDLVMIGGLTLLMLAKVIGPTDALSGFANESLLSIGALYVVAAGLRETGALNQVVGRVFGRPKSATIAQARMMLPVAVMGAFMNSTPLVAAFLPYVSDWARQCRLSPSKLMIPLSYAAIFGGTCTLIGTSTNLVVNGMLTGQAHLPGMGFFQLSWIGVPCALIGLTYVLVVGRWLLPERIPVFAQAQDAREYTIEMMVQRGGPLAGHTVQAAGLRHLPGLYLVEIERGGEVIPAAGPDEVLKDGDRLVFAGVTESVIDLQRIKGLVPATEQVFKLDSPRTARTLIEAVVAPGCPLLGKTIREGQFRTVYKAVVIAVARNGRRIEGKIGDIQLRAGDTLLLETDREFPRRHRNSRDFLLLHSLEGAAVPRHDRAFLAWGILLALILTKGFNLLPLSTAAFCAAGLMILTRCIGGVAARRSLNYEVLIAIGASFGIGKALELSGAAGAIAHGLVTLAHNDPFWLLAAIYGGTMLLTEVVTHNAAAVIVFPIALATTTSLGLNFTPFVMAITMAASASFATPIGYATNLMVYGPGGYRFSDFLRFGIPLNLMMWVVTVNIIPHVWPLVPA
jgi:di/tricarboxylate transporter